MRRLLFSASLLLAFGCSSQKAELAKPQDELKQESNASKQSEAETPETFATDIDGPKATSSGPRKMTAGKAEKGSIADPSANDDRREMSPNDAPGQSEIDSIKQEIQKKKK